MVKRGCLPRPAVPEQAGNQLQYLQNAPGRTTKKIRIPVGRFPSGDSVGGEILNMFNSTEIRLTIMENRPTIILYPYPHTDF